MTRYHLCSLWFVLKRLRNGQTRGLRMDANGPSTSHLLFIDGFIIFIRWVNNRSARAIILRVLNRS